MANRLGERLIEAGLASAEAIEQALSHQQITAHRLGDCLIELGLVPEPTLLRFLASELGTLYVAADKLAKVTIAKEVLDTVPVRMAEAECFLPIALDAENKRLTVVMAEPQNRALVQEITLITEMNQVLPYVGARSTIAAAIKKHYYADPTAFATLRSVPELPPRSLGSSGTDGPGNDRSTSSRSERNSSQLKEALVSMRGTVNENDYHETLNILVSLLEMHRKDFRNHSAQVARQSATIARRIGVPPREVAHIQVAGQLHDLGKKPDRHLTLPLLAAQVDLRGDAKRTVRAPVKLFESVHLPAGVNSILAHLYESFDGSGVPHGVKGDDIPIGARIIAAVDAFFDFTKNPFNPTGHILGKQEALEAIHGQVGILFDPFVVDALITLQSGDLLRQRVENDGRQVFIADPDEAVRTDLMDAVTKGGLVAHAVVKLDATIDAVLANEADTLVAGLSYGVVDLTTLAEFVRARPESASIPVLVVGEPTDVGTKERLLQAGVTAFISSTATPDEAAATIRAAYLDRVENGGPGHIVRGSFDELEATELAKVLGSTKKSGRLSVRHGALEGALHLERGRVLNANFTDKKGESAVAALLELPHAEFQYDPESVLTEMPNVDLDLEVIARALGERVTKKSTRASLTVVP
jgi:response regulator RpfG family c-di-GMP phosphodiesterase